MCAGQSSVVMFCAMFFFAVRHSLMTSFSLCSQRNLANC